MSPLTAFLRRSYAMPRIAAVNGPALAGGFELVLCRDLVVAAEHAWFSLLEVARGLFRAGAGTFLPRRLPLTLALEMGITGDPLEPPRALAVGMTNRVVPPDRVLEESLVLASTIAECAPLAAAATKALMLEVTTEGSESQWASIEAKAKVFASADAKEGVTAFVNERAPHWTGS